MKSRALPVAITGLLPLPRDRRKRSILWPVTCMPGRRPFLSRLTWKLFAARASRTLWSTALIWKEPLILSIGAKVWAIDPRLAAESGVMLWSRDLTDPSDAKVFTPLQGDEKVANNLLFGPVNALVVCFRQSHDLVAADPLTGETLWLRLEIPAGSEVFGDEQYIFVLPPGASRSERIPCIRR